VTAMIRFGFITVPLLIMVACVAGCSGQETVTRTIKLHSNFPSAFRVEIGGENGKALKIDCSTANGDCSNIEITPDKTGMEGTPVSFSVTPVDPPFSLIRSHLMESEVRFVPLSGEGPGYTFPLVVPVRSWIQTHFWWAVGALGVLSTVWLVNLFCRLFLVGAFGQLRVLRPMSVQGKAIFPRRRYGVFHFSRNKYSIGGSKRDDQFLQDENWKGMAPAQIQLKYRRDFGAPGGAVIQMKSTRQFFFRWGKPGIVEERTGTRSFDVIHKPDYELLPGDDIADVLVVQRHAYQAANHLELKAGATVTLVYDHDTVFELCLKK